MTQIKDGGPAFPLQSIGPDFAPGYAGMTLRDYFAAQAMRAWFSDPITELWNPEVQENGARDSYAIADAMLRARGTP